MVSVAATGGDDSRSVEFEPDRSTFAGSGDGDNDGDDGDDERSAVSFAVGGGGDRGETGCTTSDDADEGNETEFSSGGGVGSEEACEGDDLRGSCA